MTFSWRTRRGRSREIREWGDLRKSAGGSVSQRALQVERTKRDGRKGSEKSKQFSLVSVRAASVSAKSPHSCLTLCDPVDCSPLGSPSMIFSRQEYWSGLPFPPLGNLPRPGIEPLSHVSCTGGWVLHRHRHLSEYGIWKVESLNLDDRTANSRLKELVY